MPKSFFDTNVRVYTSDHDEPDKRRIARVLLRRSAQEGSGVISTQVVQEFFVSATRKLSIEPMRAKGIVSTFRPFELVVITLDDINRAIEGVVLWQISFWDALILAAAGRASCSMVYSEDLNPGQFYSGVEVRDPFTAG